MKKIFNNILLLLFASAIVLSCKEDEKVVVAFSLSAEELAFGEDGGTELVEVTSNSKWQATTDATWLKVSPSSGLESGVCEIAVDSSVVADYRNAEIMFMADGMQSVKIIKVVQAGYAKGLYIENSDQEVLVENAAAQDDRYFVLKVTSNVKFTVNVEADDNWLRYSDKMPDFDYGDRPRNFEQKFAWDVNVSESERVAKITFNPEEGEPVVINVRQKSAPKITDDRAGDSLAILAIYDSMNGMLAWNSSENMMYWDGVELWQATDKEVKDNPELLGRLKSVLFRLFETKETLPYQVKYLKTAQSITFTGNANTFIKSIRLGDDITELAQYGNLKKLTISSYGLVTLPDNFKDLGTTLEYLDLGSNNFEYNSLDCLTPENFPNLKVLKLSKLNRYDTTKDLSNIGDKDSIGFRWYTGFGKDFSLPSNTNKDFFLRLLKWENLQELSLSLNLLEGNLPTDQELLDAGLKAYTEDDFNKELVSTDAEKNFIDTISTAKSYLLGAPKVWPKMRFLSLNLSFLTGEIPDWILYHPYLDFWNPFSMIFQQEIGAKNSKGENAGFTNEPTNLSNYTSIGKEKSFYEMYPMRRPNYTDEDGSESGEN